LDKHCGSAKDATFFTAWDNATVGNFLFSGGVLATAYTAGDTYAIPSGSLTASLRLSGLIWRRLDS
jgi:hypothetical protein